MNPLRPCPDYIRPFLVLAVLTAVVMPFQARAQSDFPLLALAVHTNRAEYWLGEPVVARARIVNWLAPKVQIVSALSLEGDSDLRIVGHREMPDRYFAHLDLNPVTPLTYYVEYGQYVEFNMVALFSRDEPSRMAFPEPGTYYFGLSQSLRYTRIGPQVDSPVMSVVTRAASPVFRVVAPPGEGQAALELLKANPRALHDLNARLATPASRHTLETIARDFPRTRYAPYCLYALARQAFAVMTVLDEEKKAAEWALATLIRDYADFPLRNEARMVLAELYEKTDRFNKAVELANEVVAESEDNLVRFQSSSLIKPRIGSANNPYAAINRRAWFLFDTTRQTMAYQFLLYRMAN